MILPIIPLSHLLLGFLALAWGRSARATLIAGAALDAGMIGLYFAGSGWFEPIMIGGWESPVGIALSFDSVSLVFLILATGLELALTAYAWGEERRPYFFMLVHALFAATYALIFAQDLFNIYVILELLTLTSFLLVAYERRPRQVWASLKYLIFASLGMSLFLLGATIAYGYTGSFNLSDIHAGVTAAAGSRWIPLCAALMFAGVAVKGGIFSFSLWLPAAHSTASAAISALLSGLVIKMGIVVLIRLHAVFQLDLPLVVFGGLTGIIGAVYATASFDIKRLLAFSTLSQIGYLLLALRLAGEGGLIPLLAYALAHGWFKGLLFLSAGEAARAVGSTKIPDLIDSRARIPLAPRLGLLVGTFGILAVPPLAGYIAKGPLLSSTTRGLDLALLLIIGVGTAASFAKLVPILLPKARAREDSPSRASGIWFLAILVALFLPIAWGLFGEAGVRPLGSLPIAWETLATIGLGLLIGRHLLHRPLRLPNRIFHAGFGVVSIIAGFLAVYFLLSLA